LITSEDCAKKFPNDPTIAHTVVLMRRVPPRHFCFDRNLGRWRPSSAAFEDDDDGDPMSVYRRDIIAAEGGPIQRVMAGHEGYGLAPLTAGQVRSKEQTVHPDPLPAESSHTHICGEKPRPTRRWFAQQAEWVIPPPA
jgi:hypothetical protein